MLNVKKLQAIRDKILGVTVNPLGYGDLNSTVYLQQILDAVQGTTSTPARVRGNLHEKIYLQKIRNAKRGVADGQFGSMPNAVYLQQIVNAFNGVADGKFGSRSENDLLDVWYTVAASSAPTCTITCAQTSPTAVSPLNYTFTFSVPVTGFVVGDITVTGGTAGGFAGSGAIYTANITPTGNAPVVVSLAAGVCVDAAGQGNLATAQFKMGIRVTLTYQPAEATMLDTWVSTASADTNHGTEVTIRCTKDTGNSLLKFPISLGASPTVQSGVLSLYVHTQAINISTITASRLLAAVAVWTEASTWNYMTPSTVRWPGDAGGDGGADAGCGVSGTDYSSTPFGSVAWPSNFPAETEFQINLNTSELALMCANNYGMQLKSSGVSEVRMTSSSYATATARPKLVLVVDYLP